MWRSFHKLYLYFAALFALAFLSPISSAQPGPSKFNISGALYQANGTAITNANVAFRIEIWNASATCMLYSEQHPAQDLSVTKGGFSLVIGEGTSQSNPLEGTSAFSAKIFHNSGVIAPFAGCASGVNLASGEERLVRVSYDLGSGYVAMTPDVPITSAPYAMVADSLQGKAPSDFILTNVNTQLSQNSMEYLFTNTNYANLKALVDGTSTQYMVSNPASDVSFNSRKLVNVANPTAPQDASTKDYTDNNLGGQPVDMTGVAPGVGGNSVLAWDQVQNKWVARTFGSISSITAGTGLNGGTIVSAGTLSVDVGTTANKILQLNGSAQIPSVNGSLLTNVNAVQLWSRDVSSVAPTGGQVLTWNTAGAMWEASTPSGGTITALVGDVTASGSGAVTATIANNAINSAKINSTGISKNLLLITDNTTGAGVGYMSCSLGQVLQWDANGWGCVDMSVALGTSGVTAGTYGSDIMVPRVTVDAQGRVTALSNVNIAFPVTTVAGRTGAVTLIASDIGGLGTAALVNVGTGSSNVPQLDALGRMPAVDGSQLTNLTAGSVSGVATGTGLVGGTITTYGTLSVDVGTIAGKIVQLTGSAQLPAVDGNLVTNINAVKLQARNVSATAPNPGQVLSWNGSSSQWEPASVTSGTVMQVASGTGLLGGPISSTGTLSVDVGTGANQIVQLDSSAKLPGVDGSALSNLNATRIGTRTVATTAPGIGQILSWNNSTSQWEPMAPATSGTVTNVATGNGLLGGPITNNGTLSVDTGVTGNKILQLTAGAQIPAVDGNLVTNVNAVKLQARDVAATAPISGQVLGWNGLSGAWEPISTAVGSVTNIATGTGILGGPISSSGTISVDVGTTSGKILQLNANAQIPAVDGYLITNINAFRNGGNTFGSNSSLGNSDNFNLSFLTGGSPRMVIDTSGNVGIGTGTPTARLTVNGNIAFPDGSGTTYTLGTTGWDDTAFMRLSREATIQADSPDTLRYSAYGYHRFFVNTLNVLEVNRSGEGALLYIGGGSRSSATPVTSTLITSGNTSPGVTGDNLLITTGSGTHTFAGSITIQPGVPDTWNGTTDMTGAPMYLGGGTSKGNKDGGPIYFRTTPAGVSGFQMNPYVTAMTIAGSGNVGIGTETPNALLDVAGTLRVTTICDSNGANCKTVSGGWGAGGSVTNVTAGTGLTGGSISSAGTLSVDVGTTSGKILQLTAGAQIPAVDGNLVTNVNAAKLQTRDVASTAPTAGQVLGWNASSSLWEPSSVTSGTVTTVNSGAGLIGGPITNNGTLSVDVGTTSYKIVQLNASAQLPAVDGSLLTNINSWKLGGNTVGADQSIGNIDNYGFAIKTNNTNRITVANDGNVGIGTTTPSSKLGVAGDIIASRAGNTSISAIDTTNGIQVSCVADSAAMRGYIGTISDHSFDFRTDNSVRMLIDRSGNVGIGTTTPRAILEISSTAHPTASAIILPRDTTANRPATGVNGMLRYNTDTSAFEGFTNGAWDSLGGNAAAQWNSGAASSINYTSGKVGIGTISPSSQLSVMKAGTTYSNPYDTYALTIHSGSTDKRLALGYDDTLNAGVIAATDVNGAWNTNLLINAQSINGLVGIGTMSPTAKLTVDKPGASVTNPWSNATLNIQGGASGRNLALGFDDTLGAAFIQGVVNSGTWRADLLLNSLGGNVGVGTTTPNFKLDVAGSLNASAIYLDGQLVDLANVNGAPATSGGGVQTIRQTATNAATNYRSALILRNDGTGGNYELNLTGQNSSGTITSAIRADGGAYFAGPVGIGTPSPVAPLHILDGINSNIFLGTSTNNAGEHQIGFGFHTLNSVAAAIVGKSTATNGRGNLEFRVAAGGDGTSATSSDTVLRLQPTIAEVMQPLSVRSITIDGTSSTNKRIQVGTDLPSPDDSTLLIKAGDANYGDRGGGNLILSSGGNAGAGSGVDGYVAIRTSQSVAPSSSTNATAEVARFLGSGDVGIGTTTPNAKLEVVGTIYSRPNPTSGATINLALSNTHLVTSVGGSAITLQNMTHGGQYTIIVQDTTSRQYTFTGCDSSYFKPANAATVNGKHTIYGIITVRSGANWICYISWSSDFG